jgi:4-phytase/acid phosphatase/peptide/nickel transport system substrate-binding protein
MRSNTFNLQAGMSRFAQCGFILFILVLSIILGSTTAVWAGPKYGGTLRILGEVDAMGFDAIKARSALGGGRAVGSLVMEKLFARDQNDTIIPVLGISASPSDDGKTWTIKLRQGVKFHDGTPFNADAVVHHWQRLLDPKNRYRQRILFRPIIGVEKTAEYEVRFLLQHAWLPFMAVLTDPSGFTAMIPSPRAVDDNTHNLAPVGTGPFVFKEWKRGDHITVTKNPGYWRKDRPYLDAVTYIAIPDHEARYATLVSGQADVMITDRPAHVKKLSANSDFQKHIVLFRGAGILALNTTRPPFDDVRVRRALAHAWDQKKYIRTSYRDITPPAEHWFGNALECSDTGYPIHDPEKARALLADYGKPVEFEYIHTATTRGREAFIILQQMMKAVGVKVNPAPSDFPGIMKKLFTKNYDSTSWVIRGGYDMGPSTTVSLFSKSPWNVTGYTNPEVDQLLMKQRLSTDPAVRTRTWCAIAQKVNQDAPFLYLFGRQYYFFARNYVKNINPPSLGEEGVQFDLWLDR